MDERRSVRIGAGPFERVHAEVHRLRPEVELTAMYRLHAEKDWLRVDSIEVLHRVGGRGSRRSEVGPEVRRW